jgi:hypothetical protein
LAMHAPAAGSDPVAVPGNAIVAGVQSPEFADAKLATSVRLTVAVKVKLALVETTVVPSVQFVNANPDAGVATTVTDAP